MTTELEGGEGSASRLGRSLPPGKTLYPLYRRLGGPQDRSGQVWKISPPTGFRSADRPARSQLLSRLRYPAHYQLRGGCESLCRLPPKPCGWAVEIFGESRSETIALTAQPNLLGYIVIVRDRSVAMKGVLIFHCCILLTGAV